MNYLLISPLEHIAVAKIATTLWNQNEIRNLMQDFLSSMGCYREYHDDIPLNSQSKKKWLIVEDNVRKKAHQLPLPELLKEKVLNAINPVGCLILKWMRCYSDAFFVEYSNIDLPREFCWTSRGILDETETAKLLIKDKNINIRRRYEISCIYCLEDNIKELWNELPEDSKKSISSERMPFNRKKLVSFWTDFINGCDFIPDYLSACQDAWQNRNRAAAEYFFKKLHLFDRNKVLHSLAKKIRSITKYTIVTFYTLHDIMLNLLTHASEEQQTEFLQMHPYAVLVCLLDWPWQGFFTKTVNYLKTFLPEDSFDKKFYDCLLRKVTFKIMYGYKDFMYQNLLEEYWQRCSDQCKKAFLYNNNIGFLLSKLFAMKDMDNINMLLRDATISAELIRYRRYICKDMIECEKWDLLKFFIQECVPSEPERLKFKADMKEYMARLCTLNAFQRDIDKWNVFFSLLEEIDSESSKWKFIEDPDNDGI